MPTFAYDDWEQQILRIDVQHALERLSESERALVELYLQGKNLNALSRALHRSRRELEAELNRALETLRQALR
ncbi:MAG: hypothetical protein N2554_01130 [Fimbriimonadales bacterium]|nr:hypothetical protein [Fimbriimonadales bacterium]